MPEASSTISKHIGKATKPDTVPAFLTEASIVRDDIAENHLMRLFFCCASEKGTIKMYISLTWKTVHYFWRASEPTYGNS